MTEEHEYHFNKKPGKSYISSRIMGGPEKDLKIRIASKVIDSKETYGFAVLKEELVLRKTSGGRQEIVAKFIEDDRQINVLTLQRFTTKSGSPHKTYFSFVDHEIDNLLEFIYNIKKIYFPNSRKINVTDGQLKEMILSPDQAKSLVQSNQELVVEFIKANATKEDIIALGYRKKQLDYFYRMLTEEEFFQKEKEKNDCTTEGLWQKFFENNSWIFGYGLNYIFLQRLDDGKLEKVVQGYDVGNHGKRVDALMKTSGAINALCFIEIKKHDTELLKRNFYRSGCWSPSAELSGAVTQVQVTVTDAVRSLTHKMEPHTGDGVPTGETIFNYQPRSFLVVGSLTEFNTDTGVNIDKYRSFELFRRNTHFPEIITFDELYHRAKFIVDSSNK